MTKRPENIRYRQHLADDVPFIVHAWLHANLTNPIAKGMRPKAYFAEQEPLIHRLLRDYGATVAYHRDTPTEILSWACGGRDTDARFVLHFVYTKRPYRRLRLARDLLAAIGWRISETIYATHVTHAHDGRFDAYPIEVNPYLLMR